MIIIIVINMIDIDIIIIIIPFLLLLLCWRGALWTPIKTVAAQTYQGSSNLFNAFKRF